MILVAVTTIFCVSMMNKQYYGSVRLMGREIGKFELGLMVDVRAKILHPYVFNNLHFDFFIFPDERPNI
jgi:hypothetical protein